jgi:zinc D-Ala-D-Ala carboxypeptidase
MRTRVTIARRSFRCVRRSRHDDGAVLTVAEIHRALGIPPDYGRHPFRPEYIEARYLVEVGIDSRGRAHRLAPDAAWAWSRMVEAARADGVQLTLVSGFRSIEYQCEIFRRKLAAGATIDAILRVNAAPGFSQHHTGCAVDVGTPGRESLTEEFEDTDAFRWLVAHAQTFGFSMSYPRDNPFGFTYEPWHWAHAAIGV